MLKIVISFIFLLSTTTFADDHGKGGKHERHDDHQKSEKVVKPEVHEEEKDHDDHGDHDEHDEHSEKKDGFALNDASKKTFELQVIKFVPQKTLITKNAIYKGLNEVNIYRLRAGLYKRIDFKIVSQNKNDYLISSADLTAGDEIVTHGVGFLRMAEIAASGGLSDSHSH